MVTLVRPLAVACVGVEALTQLVTALAPPAPASPLSGIRPPALKPFGTLGSRRPGWFGSAPRLVGPEAARLRAVACTACMAWIARVSDLIDCCVAAAACCALVMADADAFVVAENAAP